MQALTKINAHIDACERRYQEGNQRLEKLFNFIQTAHSENRSDISEIKDKLAEQRGAGKMGKVIGHAATSLLTLGASVGAFKILR